MHGNIFKIYRPTVYVYLYTVHTINIYSTHIYYVNKNFYSGYD